MNKKERIIRLEKQNKVIIEKFLLMEMQNIFDLYNKNRMHPHELYTLMCSKAAEYNYSEEYDITIHGVLMSKIVYDR